MRMASVAWTVLLPLVLFARDIPELPQYHERAVDNYPYVMSDAEGRFYARSTPADNRGTTGTTQIYRVGEGRRDKLLTTYKWYERPRRLILCGNPETNEVTVVLHNFRAGLDIQNVKNETALSFFAGGTVLMTYRVKDLEQFGVKDATPEQPFYIPNYVMEGCKRVGESKYAITLRTNSGKRIQFDFLTGRPFPAQ